MRSALFFDWRSGYRSLRATPVVTVVAIASLALGIGANTALFSILNSLVLKVLPVQEPERLVLLSHGSWTNPIWEQIRDRQDQLFDGAFAWSPDRFDLSLHGQTDLVSGAFASGRMFQVLGIKAVVGRTFTEADDTRRGGPDGPVAVISHSLWQRRYGGGSSVIGQPLSVNGVMFTIIGVTPAGFFGPDVGRSCDVLIPLGTEALIRGKESFLDGRSTWWLEIIARLKRDQTLEQANTLLRASQPQIRSATLPGWSPTDEAGYLREAFTFVPAASGRSELRGRYEQPLTIIMIVVGAVLLIACANIANLLLARATARRHELVVRLALGASRFRLARQLLTESLMLAFAGAAAGLVLAQLGSALLVRQLSTPRSPVFLDLSLDWRVLAFTSGVAVMTALLFGLAPAFSVTHASPHEALKEQARTLTGDRRFGVRSALVVTLVALSLALVVAAGLFVRTFSSLISMPLGFNPEPLMILNINVQRSATAVEQRPALFERLREAAASVPGVRSASYSVISPLSGQGWNSRVAVPEGSALSAREQMCWVNAVSPGWFSTYGMHLVAGRDISASDRAEGPRVTVVNQTFARRFIHAANPVGAEVRMGGPSSAATSYQVIGVVADALYRSRREGMMPTMYRPLAQADRPFPSLYLAVEMADGPRAPLQRDLAQTLSRADAGSAFTFQSLSDQVRASVAQERLVAMLSGFFGGLALLLAGLGLYGVTSYSVNRRRTELAVRLALGANPRGVIQLVLHRVAWLVGLGVISGIFLSWWASRFVTSALLFRLAPRDPINFVTAAIVLVLVGVLAAWLPARRAGRIDPVRVLRAE